ncbi:hypothetical protein PJWF_00119 [Achromobacter phage JWF]|uniref:hypothetical protein n=1 Tax=Achromobacter phage JWF TaxID=1589748 RepID=UPI000588E740|nr:hypothetical protein AXJ13_gp002 [Achromobacter phage JWF]YP_009224124.1 hypothetical protein AXJ13_gp069 [Achromobacter phage JWF]AJD82896.1 hypothetical protein PJWF_00002 [Achromobacter phage JWF]AJD83012.1 hypothetical protein PJWF_00119 [Achromobacter phage JWF]
MQTTATPTTSISVTRAAIVKAMRADLGGYAAVIAHAVLDGKANERGYAADLRKALQLDAAMATHGKAWETMDDATRDEARGQFFARFKKYAEKGVAIACIAAERGLNVTALHDLSQADAIKAVCAWLTGHVGVTDIESLWTKFGFAGGNAKREKAQKPATPPAPTAGPDQAPEVVEDVAPLASATGPEAYAATIAAQMQAMSDDDRAVFIKSLMAHIVDMGYSVHAEDAAVTA